MYENMFGDKARTRLREALEKNDREGLADVAQRFQHTKAGFEANEKLATYFLDRGQYFMAALRFGQRDLNCTPVFGSGSGAGPVGCRFPSRPSMVGIEPNGWWRRGHHVSNRRRSGPDGCPRTCDSNVLFSAPSSGHPLIWLTCIGRTALLVFHPHPRSVPGQAGHHGLLSHELPAPPRPLTAFDSDPSGRQATGATVVTSRG